MMTWDGEPFWVLPVMTTTTFNGGTIDKTTAAGSLDASIELINILRRQIGGWDQGHHRNPRPR